MNAANKIPGQAIVKSDKIKVLQMADDSLIFLKAFLQFQRKDKPLDSRECTDRRII